MIKEIKRIEVWSAIKISFFVNAVFGLAIGILAGLVMAFIFSLAGQFDPYGTANWGNFNPAAFGIFGGFLIGFGYAIFIAVFNGIIVTLIVVLLYNLFAGWLGGVKVHIRDEATMEKLAPPSDIPPSPAMGDSPTNV